MSATIADLYVSCSAEHDVVVIVVILSDAAEGRYRSRAMRKPEQKLFQFGEFQARLADRESSGE
jgi:hypothetical protein